MLVTTQILLGLLLFKGCLIAGAQAKSRLETTIQRRWVSESLLYGGIILFLFVVYSIFDPLSRLTFIFVEWVVEPFLIVIGLMFVLSEARSQYEDPK